MFPRDQEARVRDLTEEERGQLLPREASGKGRLLCVSENVPLARRELLRMLEDAGYEVDILDAGSRKVGELPHRRYRLILFDISTRADATYQLCAQARSASPVPILLVLHGAARYDVLRGYAAGADAYVLVPFDPREFMVRMQALLRRQASRIQWA